MECYRLIVLYHRCSEAVQYDLLLVLLVAGDTESRESYIMRDLGIIIKQILSDRLNYNLSRPTQCRR